MTTNDKIRAIRTQMSNQNLAAYIIPSSDPHQSEYVATHWKSREWVSGFTGSAGISIILENEAALWTDSRYFLQGEKQLEGSEMELHKQGIPHAPEHIGWLKETLKEGDKIGLDGRLFSVGQIQNLQQQFKDNEIELVTDADFIIDSWKDRPTMPTEPIFEHDAKYSGKTRAEKLDAVRKEMATTGCQHYLVSTLDDIAYVLNLRGKDVACNPVFYSYAIISENSATLFIDENKVSAALKSKLATDNISVENYFDLEKILGKSVGKILIDLSSTSYQVYNSIKKENRKHGKNIIREHKAIKTPTEVKNIKNAMLKDAVALTRLRRWLDKTLEERSIPETEVAEQLIEFRRAQGEYHNESFDAIVGYNGNGAIVHYRAEQENCAHIKKEGMLLLDSGGQYSDGTTDITRTFALGEVTVEQKRNFTLVLKGHIALDTAKFPHGTSGVQLDTLARINLWKDGLNYGHGTGHGVGFFLNVHEPPQGFATNPSTSRGTTAVVPGMFTSNEPGFYKADEYGIRIENLVLCVEDEENDFGKFYKFENLTLFPIDLNLVEKSLLNQEEIDWLNDYHKKVFELVSPRLEKEEVDWLRDECREI